MTQRLNASTQGGSSSSRYVSTSGEHDQIHPTSISLRAPLGASINCILSISPILSPSEAEDRINRIYRRNPVVGTARSIRSLLTINDRRHHP
jgi:hypothetical protein